MSIDKELKSLENSLADTFNVDDVQGEIREMRDRLAVAESLDDPSQIIKLNIERANHLLDTCEEQIAMGNFSARLLEVCGKLISEVTSAANSLVAVDVQSQTLNIKEKHLELKEFEFQLKSEKNSNSELPEGSTITQNNIVVADRESVLDIINNNKGKFDDLIKQQQENENASEEKNTETKQKEKLKLPQEQTTIEAPITEVEKVEENEIEIIDISVVEEEKETKHSIKKEEKLDDTLLNALDNELDF